MTDTTTKPARRATVKLLYDVWEAEDVRHEAGSTVSLPMDLAKSLLAEKKAERADPLPGDN